MQQLRHVQSTLGWALIGLVLTYLLPNVVGFISPFWAHWTHSGDIRASLSLLHFWQPVFPWFSICFLAAAWHLSMTFQSTLARIGVVALGVLVPVAHIGGSIARRALQQADTPIPPQLSAVANAVAVAYIGVAALIFVALFWRAVRQSNNSFTGMPLRGTR